MGERVCVRLSVHSSRRRVKEWRTRDRTVKSGAEKSHEKVERRRTREAARESEADREERGVRESCFRSIRFAAPATRSPVARLKRTLKSHSSPLPSYSAPWLFRFIVRDTICIAITMPTLVGTNLLLPFRHLSRAVSLSTIEVGGRVLDRC